MGLTNAERQARWRENHPEQSVGALKGRIAELEEALAKRPDAAKVEDDVARLQTRIRELEQELLKFKTGPDAPIPKTWDEVLARGKQIREAEKRQRAEARKRKGEKLAETSELTLGEALMQITDRDRQIKGLKSQLHNARAIMEKRGKLSLNTDVRKEIRSRLHPDRVERKPGMSDADFEAKKKLLHEAFTFFEMLFNEETIQ